MDEDEVVSKATRVADPGSHIARTMCTPVLSESIVRSSREATSPRRPRVPRVHEADGAHAHRVRRQPRALVAHAVGARAADAADADAADADAGKKTWPLRSKLLGHC